MSILDQIIQKRREDIARLGLNFGFDVPESRTRGQVVPFMAERGAILEIKRASPSKGQIAPDLDAAETAERYTEAGARAISVLTERNWFCGGLSDLQAAARAADECAARLGKSRVAILRKDFLLEPDEVDIAFRCGADAVLLIARILGEDALRQMLLRCRSLGMTAFVELRLEEDIGKLKRAAEGTGASIVCGVNARDLKDFSIDMLSPASMMEGIRAALGADARVIFESGIRTPRAAAFAGSLCIGGARFAGMLLGEAAAKNPAEASALVEAFCGAKETAHSRFWSRFAQDARKKPLVKVCGLTSPADAAIAASVGAGILGFIFCAKSPRNVAEEAVREARKSPSCAGRIFAGVITECDSAEFEAARRLVSEGILDVLQVHGKKAVAQFMANPEFAPLPHYCAANLASEEDFSLLEELRSLGEPRILVDSLAEGKIGGTGVQIQSELAQKVAKKQRLWLAGGITPENAASLARDLRPELLDANSGVESAPGKKDAAKIRALFDALKEISGF